MHTYYTGTHREINLICRISLSDELHSLIHFIKPFRGFFLLPSNTEMFWGYVWMFLLPLPSIASRSSAAMGWLPYCSAHSLPPPSAQVRTDEKQKLSVKWAYLNHFINHWLCVLVFRLFLWWVFKIVSRTRTLRSSAVREGHGDRSTIWFLPSDDEGSGAGLGASRLLPQKWTLL